MKKIDKFDIIVGNPPYSDGKKKKEPIRLWSLFIEKALKHLTNDGYLLFVTPSSWISSTNYAHDKIKNNLLFVNVSQDVSDSFQGIGGSQKFVYFLANNKESSKCITKFDGGIEHEFNPTNTPFSPVKSSSYFMYNVVEKLYKSNFLVHDWVRFDGKDDSSGVILPMAKNSTYDVKYHGKDDFDVSRYKLNVSVEQGENIAHNLNLRFYRILRWVIRSGPGIAGNFKLVPIPIKKMTDFELGSLLGFSKEEMEFIENA